jgi:hypothetical protein
MTLSIKGLFVTLSINYILHNKRCHYAECCDFLIAMLNVIMLSFIMLSVIMLSFILLSVIMLSVIMLSVLMLSAVLLNVVMPQNKLGYYCTFV